MSLNAATFLLQWATGGLAFLWVTTRRREVSLGYGWLLRGVYGLLALLAVPLPHATQYAFLLLCLITVYSCRRTGVMFYQVSAFSVFHRSHPFEGRSLIVSDRFAYLVFTSPHARSCAVL